MQPGIKKLSWPVASYSWIWITGIIFTYTPALWFFHGKFSYQNSIYNGMDFYQRIFKFLYHYDAIVYSRIALEGYYENYTAFFPGWIWLLKYAGKLFLIKSPEGIALLGTFINFIFLYLAISSWSKTGKIYGLRNPERLLAFYPTSVFFASAYPEILFIALGGILMVSVLEDKKWNALIFLPIFVFSKHAGIVMGTSFILWSLLTRRKIFWWLFAGWIIGTGLVLFFYYHSFGDALIWLKSQGKWGRKIAPPWELVKELHGQPVDVAFYFILLIAAPVVFFLKLKKMKFSNLFSKERNMEFDSFLLFTLYVFSLYLPLWFGGSLKSLYRIIVLGTPALFLFSDWFRLDEIKGKRWITAGIFIVLNLFSTYQFVSGAGLP